MKNCLSLYGLTDSSCQAFVCTANCRRKALSEVCAFGGRNAYRCSRCGQIKKGHVCTVRGGAEEGPEESEKTPPDEMKEARLALIEKLRMRANASAGGKFSKMRACTSTGRRSCCLASLQYVFWSCCEFIFCITGRLPLVCLLAQNRHDWSSFLFCVQCVSLASMESFLLFCWECRYRTVVIFT